jgi:hypothetical protein
MDSVKGFISGFVSGVICHPLEFLKVNYQTGNINSNNFTRGVIVSPLTYGLNYSIYYPLYTYLRKKEYSTFSSAFIAQSTSSIILNPLWNIRTQRIVLGLNYKQIIKNKVFNTTIIPNVIVGLQAGISFTICDYMMNNDIGLVPSLFVSKLVSGVLVYPMDTVRNIIRINGPLQNIKYYKGIQFYLLKSVPSFVITNYLFSIIFV